MSAPLAGKSQHRSADLGVEQTADSEPVDPLKSGGAEAGGPRFRGVGFFDELGREAARRLAVLCVLYDRRLRNPAAPSLSMRDLELMMEATASELGSAMWYLKQRGLVASDDKSSLQITVDGMDFLESKKPSADEVMPFIKDAGDHKLEANPAPEARSVLSKLNRALARGAEKQAEVVR